MQFFEQIYRIISIAKWDQESAAILLDALGQITRYAQTRISELDGQLIALFQSKYFRYLFSLALHYSWQNDPLIFTPEYLAQFDGTEAAKMLLQNLKMRLAQSRDNVPLHKILTKQVRSIRLLYLAEKEAASHPDTDEGSADFYREKAFRLIDWFPALSNRMNTKTLVNLLLQAGVNLQLATKHESNPAKKMADEQVALELYMNSFAIAQKATPDVVLYVCVHLLRFVAQFEYCDENTAEIIKAVKEKALAIADLYSFYEPINSNVEFTGGNERSLYLLRQYLHGLVDLLHQKEASAEKIELDYSSVDILYSAYEACLKNWYELVHSPEKEQNFRKELMKAVLAEKNWDAKLVRENVDFPWLLVPRNRDGWMTPTGEVAMPHSEQIQPLKKIKGFEVNYKTGRFSIYAEIHGEEDLACERLLSVYDINESFDKKIGGGFFSLDPVDPNKPYHPFNTVRFEPPSLYKTQLYQAMLITDYLLKFFTGGQEIQGHQPFDFKPLDELLYHVPEYLTKIIEDYAKAPKANESLCRFWIEAQSVPLALDSSQLQRNNIQHFALGDLKMIVKTHKMIRDMHGNLVDSSDTDEGWPIYILPFSEINNIREGRRKLVGRALIFREGENQASFLEDGMLSPPITIESSLHRIRSMRRLEKNEDGKVKLNDESRFLLYKITRSVSEQANRAHHFSPEHVFSQEFTDHYEEFAQYFPEFGRLRELSKIVAMRNVLNGVYAANNKNISNVEKKLSDEAHWEQRKSQINDAIEEQRKKYYQARDADVKANGERIKPDFRRMKEELEGCYNKYSQIAQIKEQFPNNLHWYVESALEGGEDELNRFIRVMVDEKYKDIRKSVVDDIERAKQIVPTEQNNLREQLRSFKLLKENLKKFGIGQEKTEVPLLQTKCLWVPANVKHDVTAGYSHVVYGGVLVGGQVEHIEERSPLHRETLNSSYSGNRCELNIDYMAEAKAYAQRRAGEDHLYTQLNTEAAVARERAYQDEAPPTATGGGDGGYRPPTPPSSPPDFDDDGGYGEQKRGSDNPYSGGGDGGGFEPPSGGRESPTPMYEAHDFTSGLKLRTELTLQQAGILNQEGHLTADAVAASSQVLKGGELKNAEVINELTKDGSNIKDWQKMTTQSVNFMKGQNIQVHFYQNSVTGEVNYTHRDYKVKTQVALFHPRRCPTPEPEVSPFG